MGGDALAAATSWLLVLWWVGDARSTPSRSLGLVAFVAIVAVISATHWGLYLSRVSAVRSAELAAVSRVAVTITIASWIVARGLGPELWWGWAVAAGILSFFAIAATRQAFDSWIKGRRRAGAYCRRIVLVGRDEAASELVELVEDQPELGYRIIGYVGRPCEADDTFPVRWLGEVRELKEKVDQHAANGVLVAASALGNQSLRASLCDMVEDGVHVQVSTGLQGLDHRRLRASTVGYEPVLYLEPRAISSFERYAKRATDLVIASLALVVALPVICAAAVAIKLHDRGPVFFDQERIGRRGKPFRLLKLRTMEVDAESKLSALLDENERTGPLFKLGHDPRVTPPGRFLRASSIDELPQLFNVLRGEMSLVGPRPPLPSEFDQFDDELQQRQELTPGITGLWQLEARDNPSFRAYRRLDLFYARNWSISLDLMILLLTAFSVVMRVIPHRRPTPVESDQEAVASAERDGSVQEVSPATAV